MHKYCLKNKSVKKLIKDFSEAYRIQDINQFFPKSKLKVDCIDVEDGKIYFVDGLPNIIVTKKGLFPTLIFEGMLKKLPSVVVDVGAISYICNGADVMAPGIREIEGKIEQDSTVVVFEEGYKKRIALGVSLYSTENLRSTKKGKVIENVHYVGDKFWKVIMENRTES